MKTIAIISMAAMLAVSAAHAGVIVDKAMPTAEIDKLPRDKVDAIKRACARLYEERPNYESRIVCEDGQYKALKLLIERGSEPPPK
jgi:hypothetical protein